MKKLLFVAVFLFFYSSVFSQSLNYYYRSADGSWQCVTMLYPPAGGEKHAKMFYNSSSSNDIKVIKELKDADSDVFSASVVQFGDDSRKYVVAMPKNDIRYIVVSDDKQMFKAVFTLDSYIYNPPTKKGGNISGQTVERMLKSAFKLLFF
ncbi:MAG TPA: hypothetical protein VHA56_03110 [Mucilaginibacter sp.]|nr:hypothetical protein [Mucilaginibacter sp.]